MFRWCILHHKSLEVCIPQHSFLLGLVLLWISSCHSHGHVVHIRRDCQVCVHSLHIDGSTSDSLDFQTDSPENDRHVHFISKIISYFCKSCTSQQQRKQSHRVEHDHARILSTCLWFSIRDGYGKTKGYKKKSDQNLKQTSRNIKINNRLIFFFFITYFQPHDDVFL